MVYLHGGLNHRITYKSFQMSLISLFQRLERHIYVDSRKNHSLSQLGQSRKKNYVPSKFSLTKCFFSRHNTKVEIVWLDRCNLQSKQQWFCGYRKMDQLVAEYDWYPAERNHKSLVERKRFDAYTLSFRENILTLKEKIILKLDPSIKLVSYRQKNLT